MKRRNLFLIILSVAAVAIVAVYGMGVVGNNRIEADKYMGPVNLKYADARLTGGNGSAIIVAYETNESMGYSLTANQTYLILEKNGQFLPVEYVYKIGYMESFSIAGDYTKGWFMVHNYDRMVSAGDLVTIHIGEAVLEHYPVMSSQLASIP
ncbi:MAG: hypothetical protein WCK39_08500 [Methanomassiliicoccales archaeon]